jgi:hypothetical protein
MVKSFTFIKKKAGLTQEEFLRYWKEKHGPLAARVVPGLRKYIQCHPESHRSFLTWRQSEEAKILREDEEKFIDTSKWVRFVAEEHIIVDDQAKASP